MKTPPKLDLYKTHKAEYAAPRKPVVVDLGAASYLALSGQGAPGGEVFADSIGALYAMAFTIKMRRKFAGQPDYTVCKLEAQWWSPGRGAESMTVPKAQWCWNLLIRTPESVGPADLAAAVAVLRERGKSPRVSDVKLESLTEGPCVQMLHVGPYDQEPATIARMLAHAQQHGLRFHGRHHEIYLSDPRRVPPERLKTILREPVEAAPPSG